MLANNSKKLLRSIFIIFDLYCIKERYEFESCFHVYKITYLTMIIFVSAYHKQVYVSNYKNSFFQTTHDMASDSRSIIQYGPGNNVKA